jgi:hypothetical protein
VPADRLLVWDVREGWGPLCAFLGLPVPDEPFPNVNDAREIRLACTTVKAVSWAAVLLGGGLLAAGVLVPGAWPALPGLLAVLGAARELIRGVVSRQTRMQTNKSKVA